MSRLSSSSAFPRALIASSSDSITLANSSGSFRSSFFVSAAISETRGVAIEVVEVIEVWISGIWDTNGEGDVPSNPNASCISTATFWACIIILRLSSSSASSPFFGLSALSSLTAALMNSAFWVVCSIRLCVS